MASMQHIATPWREVVFVADFFRLPAPRPRSLPSAEAHWHYFAESFYHLCRLPVAQGMGLPAQQVRLVRHNDAARSAVRGFYAQCTSAATVPEQNDWLALCRKGVTDEACAFAEQHILHSNNKNEQGAKQASRDVLVVGFSLSPYMTSVLTACGMSWINAHVHPASFMPDLLFSFSTNVPQIAEALARSTVNEEEFERCADWQKARYAPNVYLNYIPENTLLVLAQDWMDPLPLTAHGQCDNFSAHAQTLREITARHTAVLAHVNHTGPYMAGPGLCGQDEQLLQHDLNAVLLPAPQLFLKNTVMLLSHPSISTVVGLNSKRLDEARWFGKQVIQLVPSPVSFSPATPVTAESQHALTPTASCFLAEFWALLAQGEASATSQNTATPQPNARLIFRGGGSDFDDSNSTAAAIGVAQTRSEVTLARRDMLLHNLRHSLEQTPPAPPLPLAAGEQKNHALFCTGNENYLFPAIVALESTRRRTGQADAFFVTNTRHLSESGKALLRRYNIEPLHSEAGKSFDIIHLHTTPDAYVQLFVPEMLHARGYAYSLGIHADIVCVRPFNPDEFFARTTFIAASGANPAARCFAFAGNHAAIQQQSCLQPQRWFAPMNNPGVLFANNAALAKMQFSRQCVQLYAETGPEFLCNNEESLLNLFCMLDDQFCMELDDSFNMIDGAILSGNVPHFLHYLNSNKPWRFDSSSVRHSDWRTPLCPLFAIWHREAQAILEEHDYNTLIATSGV